MQMRLLASFVGGVAGAALTFLLPENFHLGPIPPMLLCSIAGVVLGYLASMLFCVFTMGSEGR